MARIADQLAAGRTLSFEYFPPKTEAAYQTLESTVDRLAALNPSFVSVTYGAGGSDRSRTRDTIQRLRDAIGTAPMAHMTCIGHTRTEVAALVVEYRRIGVQNVLALGGDPPSDGSRPAGDYAHAIDLVRDVATTGSFSIGVAAHPELHPRSPDRDSDRRHLAAKLALADFAITQFFFEVEHWTRLVDELAALDVYKPVIPGIMPVTDLGQVQRMAAMSGAAIPRWLTDRLERATDPADARAIGIDVAARLAADLVEAGAPGLHLYTLNRPEAAEQICRNVQLAPV